MEEVDCTLIYKQDLRLVTIDGVLTDVSLHVMESESPYALIFMLAFDEYEQTRLDVSKEDIAEELKDWMQGIGVLKCCAPCPTSVEKEIEKYVKFGSPPKPALLAQFLLSRCQLVIKEGSAKLKLSSHKHAQVKGNGKGASIMSPSSKFHVLKPPENVFATTVDRITKEDVHKDSTLGKSSRSLEGLLTTKSIKFDSSNNVTLLAREIMGQSEALNNLKVAKGHHVTGRKDAKSTIDRAVLTDDHYRLGCEIEKGRKDIQSVLEERRRMIEIGKTRAKQLSDKLMKVRESVNEKSKGGKWTKLAANEINTLNNIQKNIEEDIIHQRNRGEREFQRVYWTKCPIGTNMGGKSMPGPIIGRGPLPPEATTNQPNPIVEETYEKYYWDEAGRRHLRDFETESGGSKVEQVLCALRKMASGRSASKFKLNLRSVFQDIDGTGDGYVSLSELAHAFELLGFNLDMLTLEALFKQFDPNDSGSINYGEFVWAFYNRRPLLRQWKLKTDKLTKTQLRNKFHEADKTGDGLLNFKEFTFFINTIMRMDVPSEDLLLWFDKFDHDKDDTLDLNEFLEFIDKELKGIDDLRSKNRPNSAKKTTTTQVKSSSMNTSNSNRPSSAPVRKSKKESDLPPSYDETVQDKPEPIPVRPTKKFNYTSPAKIESSGKSSTSSEVDMMHFLRKSDPGHSDPTILTRSLSGKSTSSWVSDALKRQYEVEKKLGHVYYDDQKFYQ